MVKASVASVAWFRKGIEEANPDLLRKMVKGFAEILMSAEVDGFGGQSSPSPAASIPQSAGNRAGPGPGEWPIAVHASRRFW